MIIFDLWNKNSVWDVSNKFNVPRGTLHNFLMRTAAFASSLQRFTEVGYLIVMLKLEMIELFIFWSISLGTENGWIRMFSCIIAKNYTKNFVLLYFRIASFDAITSCENCEFFFFIIDSCNNITSDSNLIDYVVGKS